jgi:hypothetical protein
MANAEEWHDFLVGVAGDVDALVIENEIRGEFCKQIGPFARAWKQHWSHGERYERRRKQYSQIVKRNPRLQDKQAGPPKKGWEWRTDYLLCEDGEMPARHAEDVLLGIGQRLKKAEHKRRELKKSGASETPEYENLEYTIQCHKQNIREIREQLDKLGPKERETAWITAPPLERLFWWQQLDLSEEQIFGCWRPPVKQIRANPIPMLIPQNLHSEYCTPEGSPDLPPAESRQEEYERYYVILSSIHDRMLTGCESISKSIWSKGLADMVWVCLTKGRRPSRLVIEVALRRVKKDLEDKGLLGSENRERRETATHGPTHINQDVDNHGDFLIKIANTIHELVQDPSNRKWFQEQLSVFRTLKDEFAFALTEAQEAAMADPTLRYDYDDVRDKDKAPPKSPKEGYEVERHHVLDTPPKGFWRPPLPFNPDAWLSRFQCQWAGLVHPPAEEPRDRDQMLMCEYALLATVNDEALDIPSCDRLTDADQDDWADSVWVGVSHKGTTMDDVATLRDRQSYVETALSDVKTDLAKRALERRQRIEPVGEPAKQEMSGRLADERTGEALLDAVAQEVDEIVTLGVMEIGNDKERIDPKSALARFGEQISMFVGEYKASCEAQSKAIEQQREDYEKICKSKRYRNKQEGPPKKGLLWCDDFMLPAECLDPTPGRFEDEALAGWVRPDAELLPDPRSWPKHDDPLPTDILLACYYTTMAVIHDYKIGRKPICPLWHAPSKPKRKLRHIKLTPEQYVGAIMWSSIEHQHSGYNERTIQQALHGVKADLLKNCKLQEPKGRKPRGRPKEHSADKLKAAEKLFDELQSEGKSVDECWFEVHDRLGFKSPKAAKQAVYRFKQQNKKHN